MEETVQSYDYNSAEKFESFDKGHGRIETRNIAVLKIGPSDLSFPFVEQVFKIERTRANTYGEILSTETVFGITSLRSNEITPERLLEGVRYHWSIENKLHYVRDVVFMEDKSQIKDGRSPRIWASLRNLVIDFIRSLGFENIPTGRRFFGYRNKEFVLKALGIT